MAAQACTTTRGHGVFSNRGMRGRTLLDGHSGGHGPETVVCGHNIWHVLGSQPLFRLLNITIAIIFRRLDVGHCCCKGGIACLIHRVLSL